jgi:hypothetical protein
VLEGRDAAQAVVQQARSMIQMRDGCLPSLKV